MAGGLGVGAVCLSRNKIFRDHRIFSGPPSPVPGAHSPIDRSLSIPHPAVFVGDDPFRAHSVLWNIEKYLADHGGVPEPEESVAVAIVGGGMSGLLAGYCMRDRSCIILEQGARFGGNAKGASFQGVDYPMGAVYFARPDERSRWAGVLTDLGVDMQVKESRDVFAKGTALTENFWSSNEFAPLGRLLKDIFEETNGFEYPQIPGLLADLKSLDSQSLWAYLDESLGASWSPEARLWVEYYAWSSLGAGSREISAAAGINFLAGESGGTCMQAAGNAGIAEKLCEKISQSLRPNSIVVRVEIESARVKIAYIDGQGIPRALWADHAVVAAPKFVAKGIVRGLSELQREAFKKVRYRAYLVANVCLTGSPPEGLFDVFALHDGVLDPDITEESRWATDIVIANFASRDSSPNPNPGPDHTVLTLYRPLPFDDARPALLSPNAYSRIRSEFEGQVRQEILPLLGYTASQLRDLRITRWGHAMPVCEVGCYSDSRIEMLRAPVADRIFFANQDNWLLPGVEVCAAEAFEMTDRIKAIQDKLI